MSTIASRTAFADLAVARLTGHREGYRVLNGEAAGMSVEEQAFRYRMHELAGEVQLLRQMCGEADRYAAGLADLWMRIYGLHEYAAKSNRLDDLIMLLMMARKEWRSVPVEPEKLAVLQECLGRMARELHTEELTQDMGDMLEAGGVD
jgi:hypothetical protein